MMRLAWPIFVAASLAGCAEISGLSSLDIGDAATTAESSVDATSDAADTGTSDGSGDGTIEGGSTGTWCQNGGPGPTPYTFCSDFDESSVTAGYGANGNAASWSVVLQGPSLDTSSPYTPPGCALFNTPAGLQYTPLISQTTISSFELQSHVEIVALGNNDVTLATVNIDAAHSVTVGITFTQGSLGPSVVIKEVEAAADGGAPTVVSHVISTAPTTGNYYLTRLVVTASAITYDLDTLNNVIQRAQPSGLGKVSARIGSSATGWSFRFDDVVLRTQ